MASKDMMAVSGKVKPRKDFRVTRKHSEFVSKSSRGVKALRCLLLESYMGPERSMIKITYA